MPRGEWSVELRRVTKRFGEVLAVDDVSLDIRHGEFFALLGPSGCGKTTLLRAIGGFDLPSAGAVRIHGEDMTDVPPYRRRVNMVFQHYSLFPHLTVAGNVAFGLRYQKERPRETHAARVAECLRLVRLEGLGDRYPHQLSGGQRQRVALARALAPEPEVLLLDEPLAALDRKLRKEVQVELKSLQRSLGITFVFVTHDQEEALAMSDRLAVMNLGRVEQVDAAVEVFERPRTEFVAQFMGAGNFFAATVSGQAPEGAVLAVGPETTFTAPTTAPPATGSAVRFVVRPEKLELYAELPVPPGEPFVPVTLEERIYQGISTVWLVRDERGQRFSVYDQNDEPFEERGKFAIGTRLRLAWDPMHTVLLAEPAETRQ